LTIVCVLGFSAKQCDFQQTCLGGIRCTSSLYHIIPICHKSSAPLVQSPFSQVYAMPQAMLNSRMPIRACLCPMLIEAGVSCLATLGSISAMLSLGLFYIKPELSYNMGENWESHTPIYVMSPFVQVVPSIIPSRTPHWQIAKERVMTTVVQSFVDILVVALWLAVLSSGSCVLRWY